MHWRLLNLVRQTQGSALIEFAIVLPLLVVFVVGIYDFSGAYNQKQKIEHAAQVGAIVAGAQPTSDMNSSVAKPDSLQAVVTVIFNSLVADSVLPVANPATCTPVAATVVHSNLAWTYTISGCSSVPGDLVITIDRGVVAVGQPSIVSTSVTVSYPYHWRFNSAIQLLLPGSTYAATTDLRETSIVHNQT
ncbi:MAG TPA: TadE/TadG family type IV pilus assembly protein [Terriglobales bacterium]|nr:TadE/TadG family type IV pilus assembly protein [Terriglobales bacterium]